MTVLPATVTRAMAIQVERVKGARQAHTLGEADLLDQLAEADATIARQQARINELELLVESLQGDRTAGVDQVRGAFSVNGRPAATVKDVAIAKGFSVTKVWRYVTEGWWQGEANLPGKRPMIVYLDQELVSRPSRRKKKGKKKK